MHRYHLLVIMGLCTGCAQAVDEAVPPDTPDRISTDFGRLPSLLEGVRKDREVIVYEGLPSEFWEPELREREARAKKTTRLHGYTFYEVPQALSGADAEQVTSLFAARGSFRRYRSQKACGGYHPDFCIEWKDGASRTRALICVDCGEVKFFGPDSELHCDLIPDAGERVLRWLAPYQKNRPPETAKG